MGTAERRWLPRPDPNRPHVRLGLAWFALVLGGLALGPLPLAVVYGSAAALAAVELCQRWRRAGERPARWVAVPAAAAMPVGASVVSGVAGGVILVGVAGSIVAARGSAARILAQGGLTVQSWLFVGLAASAPVVLYRIDVGVVVAFVLLTSAYEAADHLFAVDARWPVVGVVAGMGSVGVVAFALFALTVPPFEGSAVFVYAGVLALLAPVGQVAATLLLPDTVAPTTGLRRLDSLLVAGPAWLVLVEVWGFG